MKNTRQPTSHIAPFGLRMQDDLRDDLEKAANANGRSLNAEIIARLRSSVAQDEIPAAMDLTLMRETIREAVREEFKELHEKK